MRKAIIGLATATILITSLTSAIAAQNSVGGSCTKAGLRTTVNKTGLVCTLSGKKLKWVASKPTAADSGSGFTAVALPLPITLPIAQSTTAGALTFDNLSDRVSEMSKVAWQKVYDRIAANSAPNVNVEILVGPNTPLGTYDIAGFLARTEKLHAGFNQTKNLITIFFSYRDKEWARAQLKTKSMFSGSAGHFVDDAIDPNCNDGDCQGANATMVDDSNGVIGFGVSKNFQSENYFTSGGIVGHEYTHITQGAQFALSYKKQSDVPNGASGRFMPCWLIEGQANFDGISTVSLTYDGYMKLRAEQASSHPSRAFTDFSAKSLKSYLYDQVPERCRETDEYNLGYAMGMLATEALTAVGGPESTMALFYKGSSGVPFSTAFQQVYGITWERGSEILSRVLEAQYKVLPLNSYQQR